MIRDKSREKSKKRMGEINRKKEREKTRKEQGEELLEEQGVVSEERSCRIGTE